jgi:hypothetical protein
MVPESFRSIFMRDYNRSRLPPAAYQTARRWRKHAEYQAVAKRG